jgi:hypothetical protein
VNKFLFTEKLPIAGKFRIVAKATLLRSAYLFNESS